MKFCCQLLIDFFTLLFDSAP